MSSPNGQSKEAGVFSGVEFFLSRGLPTATLEQLRGLLIGHGALEAEEMKEATHVVSSTNCFIGVDEAKGATIVTPTWVERSVILDKRQDPRYYSADPKMIFSGIVATSSDLPMKDSESIASGIVAFGGQWKEALTNDVTHLFCLSASGPKYVKALASQDNPISIQVVVPHWFEHSFKSESLLPTKNYLFPNPPVLNPDFNEKMILDGTPGDGQDGPRAAMQRALLRAAAEPDVDSSSNPNTQPTSSNKSVFSNRVLGGKRVLFSARAAQNEPTRDQVFRRRVEQVGGTYISGLSLGGDGVSKEALSDADIFITLYRDNEEYELAAKSHVIIGTPAWILYITNTGLWSEPREHLLHYPYYERPVQGFEDELITITNYTGDAREYLKKLITALGGKFTPSMTSKNTCVIASHVTIPADQPKQNKIAKAREWRIPIANHLWLEDSFREWTKMPLSDRKFTEFPQGHDWMQDINARGLGTVPMPALPKQPAAKANGASDAKPVAAAKPTSTAKSASTPKPASAAKPASTTKPVSSTKPASAPRKSDTAKQGKNASTSKTPVKTEAAKRKNDGDTSQSAKRTKTAQKGATPSPSKQAPDRVSVASSSSFVKPLSEVRGAPVKLLSPEKGKRKPRKPSPDDDDSDGHEDDGSSSDSESPAASKSTEPAPSTAPGGRTQRAAASAAQNILRNVIMPDVQKFQNEMSSSKGDVRKMEELAEKKQRRASMANHDEAPPAKKKKVHAEDENTKPSKSHPKSSQGKSDSKKDKDGDKAKSGKAKSKPTDDDKKPTASSKAAIRIVCSKAKPTESDMKKLEQLGASFTENPLDCTHLVVNSISRTEKFLCALPRCDHVITMRWIEESAKAGKLLSESNYKLSDPQNEQGYKMNLSRSLERIKSNGGKLFKGHTFFLTDKVGVDFKSLQRVIESSGGVAKLELKPTKKKLGDVKLNHVVSSNDAKSSWQALEKEGIPIYTKEFVLNSVLRQEVDLNTDQL